MDHPHASAAARLERQDSGEECAPGAAAPSGRGRPPSQLVRLYVAGLPKSMTEGQLKRMFEQWGFVRDVSILRERVLGLSRGCAFVGFACVEEAEAAIAHLNNRLRLPGALAPLEVRLARSRVFIPAGSGPEDNRQLFFSRAPACASESDVVALFNSYGVVEGINLFHDQETRTSKGCGLIAMATRAQAVAAMAALDEAHVMEGGAAPLSVKWADTDLRARRNSRSAKEDAPTPAAAAAGDRADDRTLFFARVSRSADDQAVQALFSTFGRVSSVTLFRAFQAASSTKGCGLVVMGSADEATAAIWGLHESHVWEGMSQPMVVRWMDSALQRRRREEHALMRQGGTSTPASASASPRSGASPTRGILAYGYASSLAGGSGPAVAAPPPGCAPDAYRLFVGNLPSCFSVEELRPLFEAIGPVAELTLADSAAGDPRRSAFCWFYSSADADAAVAQLHGRVVYDPTGAPPCPLVVRPVVAAAPPPPAPQPPPPPPPLLQRVPAAAGGWGALGVVAPGGAGAAGPLAEALGRGARPAAWLAHPVARAPPPLGAAPVAAAPLACASAPMAPASSAACQLAVPQPVTSSAYALMPVEAAAAWDTAAPLQLQALPTGPAVPQHQPTRPQPMQQPQPRQHQQQQQHQQPQGDHGSGDSGFVAVQLQLHHAQLHVVLPHIASIQAASSAQLSTHAVAPGVFCLCITGGAPAVETAGHMLNSILLNSA
ncbi:hypothetical protein Rsub_01960 [Raphidocelis subcapitata]|uniref:RRM domain-containing protein n=1 Tax=Raphidocelis subcapitata TaxID=307507 RepID=A0A2V0NP45_9CHLO|nr:hypothetical protein Rsub_01960 [Raphidocelis subcapitata]|eukprot:GBF89388.1 hypothetical protein Rsub_01960 [Raphidocelis subcapitata]